MSNANPNTVEDLPRQRPAPDPRPAMLPAPQGPLVTIPQILAYAKRVASDHSSTPDSPGAIIPRELVNGYAKLDANKNLLGAVDSGLVRARADVRRAVELLDAKNPTQAKELMTTVDAALLRLGSDVRKAIDA